MERLSLASFFRSPLFYKRGNPRRHLPRLTRIALLLTFASGLTLGVAQTAQALTPAPLKTDEQPTEVKPGDDKPVIVPQPQTSSPENPVDPLEEGIPPNPSSTPQLNPQLETEPPAAEDPKEEPKEDPKEDSKAEGRVYLVDNQISFVPPQGFTAMSAAEISTKFPGSVPPQHAYGNVPRSVSIGVNFSDIDLAPEQLPEVRQFLESFLEESVPGFKWVARDYETMGGSRWIKLEFISQAMDTQVHNDLYITSFQGKLLGFNFNSTLAMEKRMRPSLQASRDSILLTAVETARGKR